jgi:hypothetical protein
MPVKGYFTQLNESEFGQLIEFGSRLGGAASFITTTVSVFQAIFEESDTSRILNAIGELRQEMNHQFFMLGQLMSEHTRSILDTVNRNAMAEALSHCDAAIAQLEIFAQTRDPQTLVAANTESVLGLQFFVNLRSEDLFFLPGIIKGGTTRIAVITAQNQISLPGNINQINQAIDEFQRMINILKAKIDAAHIVEQRIRIVQCPANPALGRSDLDAVREVEIIVAFAHEEAGQTLKVFEVERPPGLNRCEQSPFVSRTRNEATQARAEGVIEEQNDLGVPGYEGLLQSWKNFLPA